SRSSSSRPIRPRCASSDQASISISTHGVPRSPPCGGFSGRRRRADDVSLFVLLRNLTKSTVAEHPDSAAASPVAVAHSDQGSSLMRSRPIAALAITTAAVLALAGCSPSGSGEESGDTLKLWHYEGADSAMGKAWDEAIKIFEKETGAKVEFEEKSFEQIRQTASQVLNSDE